MKYGTTPATIAITMTTPAINSIMLVLRLTAALEDDDVTLVEALVAEETTDVVADVTPVEELDVKTGEDEELVVDVDVAPTGTTAANAVALANEPNPMKLGLWGQFVHLEVL